MTVEPIDGDGRLGPEPSESRPVKTPGILAQGGMFLNNPDAGIEDIDELRRIYSRFTGGSTLRWLALNIGDFRPDEWRLIETRCELRNIATPYWRHCFGPELLTDLLDRSLAAKKPAVWVNIEDPQLLGPLFPSRASAMLHTHPFSRVGEIAVIYQGWWPGSVQWPLIPGGLVDYLCALEIFPKDAPDTADIEGCLQHARDAGFRDVQLCFDGRDNPLSYDLSHGPISIFTGDTVRRWAA